MVIIAPNLRLDPDDEVSLTKALRALRKAALRNEEKAYIVTFRSCKIEFHSKHAAANN